MQTQQNDWVDSIRYFRGLGRARRWRPEAAIVGFVLFLLAAVTVLAVVEQVV